MIILGTDTSSFAATAAIMRDGVIICEHTLNLNNTHSEKLLPLIENMLKATSLDYSDIDVFACGVGPGSFTGIRIGVATIKGFCGALSKKAVAVSSLEALSYGMPKIGAISVSAMYARSDEVFCAAYDEDCEILSPCVMKISELLDWINGRKSVLIGDASEHFKDEIAEKNSGNIVIAQGQMNVIRGASICEIAYKKAQKGEFTDYKLLVPSYLRKSQAERERDERLK